MIAIIPAAGLGSRMSSVTGGAAKEALPLAGRTILDWIIDEAFLSGASRVIVVSSPQKGEVERIVASRLDLVDLAYQQKANGLGAAIASAGNVSEDALILLPDNLFSVPPVPLLSDKSLRGCDGAILVEQVADELVSSYGVVELTGGTVSKVLEKPHASATESRQAVAGRYLLSDRFMRLVREEAAQAAEGVELDLTSILNRGILHRFELETVTLPSGLRRFDCGSPSGYKEAVQRFGE